MSQQYQRMSRPLKSRASLCSADCDQMATKSFSCSAFYLRLLKNSFVGAQNDSHTTWDIAPLTLLVSNLDISDFMGGKIAIQENQLLDCVAQAWITEIRNLADNGPLSLKW